MISRRQSYEDQGVVTQAEGTASANFLIRNKLDKSGNQKCLNVSSMVWKVGNGMRWNKKSCQALMTGKVRRKVSIGKWDNDNQCQSSTVNIPQLSVNNTGFGPLNVL